MGALLDASGCHILNPTTTACRDIPPPKYVTKTITTEHYTAAAETASTLFYRTKPSDQAPEDCNEASAFRGWYQHCLKWLFLVRNLHPERPIYSNVDDTLCIEALTSLGMEKFLKSQVSQKTQMDILPRFTRTKVSGRVTTTTYAAIGNEAP